MRAPRFDRVRSAPYASLSVGVLVVAAYLCLVNLGYAALWHDEAPSALIARNLLHQGDITGWDGRNLVGGTNGRTLNEDLRDVLPPSTYLFNAAGMAVFGVNETGARIVPALIGILSLWLLYLLLRQHLASHPRLVLFSLLLAACSPQLLLYFRQSRYYAFMACGVIAAFYLYERWWRTGKTRHLAALTLVAALAFFNHYAGGAATMLALAAWHLLFRARETTPRQWLALAAGGFVVVALGTAYLAWIGLIGGERSGFHAYTGVVGLPEYQGTIPPILLRLGIYTRDLFAADWISWPVLLWFVGMLAFIAVRHRRSRRTARNRRQVGRSQRSTSTRGTHGSPGPQEGSGDTLPVAEAGRVVLMGALFALFSAALSVQPVWVVPFADLRYYMGALPLLLAMKGLFVEWAWRRWKIAGGAALAVLLLSSAGSWPINIRHVFTGDRTLGLHLPHFVREIHRPYRDSIRVVSEYLLEHAEQDELVYVPSFADREALTFTTGHLVLFCCALDDKSPLTRATVESLGTHLTVVGTVPEWIVLFGKLNKENWDKVKARYVMAAQPDVHHYPTQRPEINLHAFIPLPAEEFRVHILRRRATDELQVAADALRRDRRYGEALQSYRRVLEIDPEHAPAQAGIGLTLFAMQRYEEALHALERVIAVQPDLPAAKSLHRVMGQAAEELERPVAAAKHYERALQLDPRDAAVIDRLAFLRFGQRQFKEALVLYRRMSEVDSGRAQTHANLGATLYSLGRTHEAIESFERALSLDPSLESARTALESIREAALAGDP